MEEKIYSYDIDIEHKFNDNISLETALFRTNTQDLILYHRGVGLVYRPVNIDRAYRQGAEVSLKLNISDNIFT